MNEVVAVKDAAELYARDKDALSDALERISSDAIGEEVRRQVRLLEADLVRAGGADASSEAASILTMSGFADPVPTGMPTLDEQLDGGLFPGITVLGAGSSLGKTTIMLQMAMSMILDGYLFCYFSLEMGARELVAKMISRMMYLDYGALKSSVDLTVPGKRQYFNSTDHVALLLSACRFQDVLAQGLCIVEPEGRPTALSVRDVAASAIKLADLRGLKGVVVCVDYLQLLAPENERMSERQAVDTNMLSLRQAARDLHVPILVISSINRASYFGEVSLDSFKESGAIEYGADRLIGMQPADFQRLIDEVMEDGDVKDDAKAARIAVDVSKRKSVREVELKILKNRHGALPQSPVRLDFIPAASSFVDALVDANGHAAAVKLLEDYGKEDDDIDVEDDGDVSWDDVIVEDGKPSK